jgi:hypothetical protein
MCASLIQWLILAQGLFDAGGREREDCGQSRQQGKRVEARPNGQSMSQKLFLFTKVPRRLG